MDWYAFVVNNLMHVFQIHCLISVKFKDKPSENDKIKHELTKWVC